MWHNTEIAEILKQIADDYGYDTFKHRKLCVGLCGDLFAKYEMEKSIFQMLFQAGLGETLPEAPYQSEQELNTGLLRVQKFLKKQAIATEARENVEHVVRMAFSQGTLLKQGGTIVPSIVRTYQDLHFKMTIPTVVQYQDRSAFSFRFMYKPGVEEVDTVLEKCVCTDFFKRTHESKLDYSLLTHGVSKTVITSIQHESSKLSLRDAKVEFVFLCGNRKKVITSYVMDQTKKLKLSEIRIYQMTEDENNRMLRIIDMLLKAMEPSTNTESNRGSDADSASSSYLSSNIREYSDALRKEIHFLKQGRGKKYKIVNGEKIHQDKQGTCTYTFEMETELYLPDDAPVVVDTTAGYHAVGTVLVCEDFQIMLLLDRDIQDKVKSAHLKVEPWKLLEALDEKLTSLNPSSHRLAIKLMEEGPKLATKDSINKVPKGQDQVENMLSGGDIVTVWGPPGTGKTYTMAKIAREYMHNGKTVLIVSHSNVSVDGVVQKLVENPNAEMKTWLKDGKVLRFGYVRDEKLSQNQYATSFNYALNQCSGYAEELNQLLQERDELKAKKKEKTSEYDSVQKKIKSVRKEIRTEERIYVRNAIMIGTTISKATVDPLIAERQFDLVMFDEVSMAYVPQVIVAASLASEKFICVGDFRQLPPISQNPAANLLQTDIFAYLKIVDSIGHMYLHPWLVLLNEQRRMYPDIANFSNRYVYKNLIKNHPDAMRGKKQIINSAPLSGDALWLVNLAGMYCAADKNTDGSRFNIMSAIVAFCTAVNAEKNGTKTVGIIAPYAAQVRLIRAMLRDYYTSGNTSVRCATIHQFQGSESDVIVLDAVESYPKSAVGFLMGKDLNHVLRLINVAVTRAKGKLIVVANYRFWENLYAKSDHILYRLLSYIKKDHNVIEQSEKTLKPYLQSIDPEKMLKVFTDENEAIKQLDRDIQKSRGRIIVSLPSGKLRETERLIFNMLDNADSRGIDVLMKSNDYANLPESWKRFCVGTENATFPLLIVDDEVAWYGIPTAPFQFQTSKTSAMTTVVHVIVRIKGKNTIEMIKALTELETVRVGNNTRALLKKNMSLTTTVSRFIEKETQSAGLAAFVENKEYCKVCKNPMMLAKNRKGTAYLKCSGKDCKEMKYLKPDLIDWYISMCNVQCPKGDGGTLKGGLGQYGPYVRCSCGHYLKPDEI